RPPPATSPVSAPRPADRGHRPRAARPGRRARRTSRAASRSAAPRSGHVVAIADEFAELTARVERGELLVTPDRAAVDEDLRDRSTPRATHEVGPQRVVAPDVDLLVRDLARREETLRADAVRTARRRVDLHPRHASKLDRTSHRRKSRVASSGDRRYRPAMSDARVAETFTRLVEIMARLRGPGGCPWDREQTPETLRPYLLEEAYEVLDALDAGDAAAVRDELGDLLLQVVFHAQLAAEAGRFTVADVAQAIADKLVRRHPHVFGDVRVADADEVMRNWRRIKAEERRTKGEDRDLFAGVPAALPAVLRAQQLGEKAAQVGLDWPDVRGVVA